MNRRRLHESPPVGDYLPDEFKRQAREAGTTADRQQKMQKISNLMRVMQELPSIERNNKSKLEDLAVDALFRIYPTLKKMVESGRVEIDAKIVSMPGGRKTDQTIPKSEIEKVKEKNPDFSSLEKKRHFQNAQTQARAWIDGFNYVTNFMDEELDEIDPQLYNKYRDFTKGISDFYWDNADMLERMASTGAGRIAYCDVLPAGEGKVKIEARAPHFPLLVHELIKGAEYYKTAASLPKDKDLRKVIVKSADTHKHEIQNMNFGREIVNRMRTLLGTKVNGYMPYMEVHISTQMDNLPADEYNEMMDAIVNNDKDGTDKFLKFAQNIVNKLK
jgi:hypothetical protein